MYASINTRDISLSLLRSVICTYVSTKSVPGFVETVVRQSFSELHGPVVTEGYVVRYDVMKELSLSTN